MKFKSFLLTTLCAIVVATFSISCDDNNSTIKDYDKEKLEITTYADDTEVSGGFSFTATEAWTTVINYGETVRSGSNDWITLDPASGNAGEVTVNIILDENNTGEDRSATINIICGETTLTIELVQRSSENPSDDNTGDDPMTKDKRYAIELIDIYINESEVEHITYKFIHEHNEPENSIIRVVVDGLTEDGGETVEYNLNYDSNTLRIESYKGDYLYETIEARHDGHYVICYQSTSTISAGISAPNGEMGTEYNGIEVQTYYFWRNGCQLYRTDYTSESIFEEEPSLNNVNERIYNLNWEHADVSNGVRDFFGNPYNLTNVNWELDYETETYTYNDYITYNPNVTLENVMRGVSPKEPGSFVDLNYLVTQLWVSGPYRAMGGWDGIFGLLSLTSAPSYNFANSVTYRYDEYDVTEGGKCNISYELNENNLIEAVNIDEEIRLEIKYFEF